MWLCNTENDPGGVNHPDRQSHPPRIRRPAAQATYPPVGAA
ncbi:hypothetical protein LC55x_3106 [Lysobacter capsici]|nr:hypothetical protein LC55x_3106 [Lysobacter capsici]